MIRQSLAASIALGALLIPSAAAAANPSKQECVAANEAAQDLRRAGKLREAREKFALCVAQSCPGPVRDDCAQRLDEVTRAMPTLVFEAKDGSGNDLSAVQVRMDGQPLADRLEGTAVQVDPGEHHFTFTDADGLTRVDKTVVVREGDKDRHVRVVLGAAAPSMSQGEPSEHHETAANGPSADGSSQRTIGLALGGAGVVGLVVGGIFGLVSKSTYDHALQSECGNNPSNCSTQGAQDGQTAHSQATISTVGFVAGTVLLGGGLALYLTAPKAGAVAVSPTIGTSTAGLSVRGAW